VAVVVRIFLLAAGIIMVLLAALVARVLVQRLVPTLQEARHLPLDKDLLVVLVLLIAAEKVAAAAAVQVKSVSLQPHQTAVMAVTDYLAP
tara:strand:- start:297 stop:566 length:270 start_codon:yes stop_codon:yes gene_type:complete